MPVYVCVWPFSYQGVTYVSGQYLTSDQATAVLQSIYKNLINPQGNPGVVPGPPSPIPDYFSLQPTPTADATGQTPMFIRGTPGPINATIWIPSGSSLTFTISDQPFTLTNPPVSSLVYDNTTLGNNPLDLSIDLSGTQNVYILQGSALFVLS